MRGTLPHGEYVQNNPSLPIVRAQGVHPLLEDVEVVVANHPAVLFNVGGPVLRYTEDGGLVYDMNLGDGKAVVVADPSVFINHMLGVADNAQFVRNTLLYLCRARPADASDGTCRLKMAVGQFEQIGSYRGADDLFGDREELLESVISLNETIDETMATLTRGQVVLLHGDSSVCRADRLPALDLSYAAHACLQLLHDPGATPRPRAAVGV